MHAVDLGRVLLLAGCVLTACGNPVNDAYGEPGKSAGSQTDTAATKGPGPLTKPPFEARGELDGFLLTWIDAQGAHSAQKRTDIPEANRAYVRIDSLQIPPDARLDADHVYVADLRQAGADGRYAVRIAERSWFDAQVDKQKPVPKVDTSAASVVIYKASWCGVCKSAEAFLRSRHVAFVEKDVEKDPGAQAEMMQKAQAKGLSPHGIPVIDFHGEIMLGFDQAQLQTLIDRYAKAI